MIRYSNATRHNPRYMPWHQNVFVWHSVGSGGAAPVVTTTAPNTWHAHSGFGRHSTHGKGYSA